MAVCCITYLSFWGGEALNRWGGVDDGIGYRWGMTKNSISPLPTGRGLRVVGLIFGIKQGRGGFYFSRMRTRSLTSE